VEALVPIGFVAAAVAVWWVTKPPAAFIVRVRDGLPSAHLGKVTDAFLVAVADVFRDFGLAAGEIRGLARGRRIALWFSSGIPEGACQRLRNWWAISGWSARPRNG